MKVCNLQNSDTELNYMMGYILTVSLLLVCRDTAQLIHDDKAGKVKRNTKHKRQETIKIKQEIQNMRILKSEMTT